MAREAVIRIPVRMTQPDLASYYTYNITPPASGMGGMGLTYPNRESFGYPNYFQVDWMQPDLEDRVAAQATIPLDPIVIAVKVAAGQSLSAQEQAVWNSQSETAKSLWLNMARATSGASTAPAQRGAASGLEAWFAGSTALFGTTVKNSYLAAGAGVLLFALAMGRRKR